MTTDALSANAAAPEEDITTSLYRAAIGPVGAGYYLPIFMRFEEADRASITWNTTAAVFTLHWLLFRQLYLYALAYVGAVLTVVLLVFGIGGVLLQFPDALLVALGIAFGAMSIALPGLFGNILLHTECRKRMAAAVAAHHNMADARAALQEQASTRRKGIVLASVQVLLVLVFALVFWQASALMSSEPVDTASSPPPTHRVEMPATGSLPIGVAASAAPVAIASAPASAPVDAASAPASSAASSPASTPASLPASAPMPVASAPAPQASAAASAPVAPTAPAAPVSSVAKPASAPAPIASAPAASTSVPAPTATAKASEPTKPVASKSSQSDKAAQRKALQSALRAPDAPASTASKPAKAKPVPSAKPQPKVEAKATPKAASKSSPSAAAASAAEAADKPYFINVGVFAVSENAERAQAKLQSAQLPVVSKELKGKNGPITRVRVGPYSNELEARAAAEKIKGLQLEAVVVQP